jgi:hypothetical protein
MRWSIPLRMRWSTPLIVAGAVGAGVLAGPAGAATFRPPVEPVRIEQGCDYGGRGCLDPSRYHTGVDLLPDQSDEPILAAADGIVRLYAATADGHGFGNAVILEHTLPDGSNVSTVYGHMRRQSTVAVGDCVPAGTELGLMGDTGAADDVHLHFEVKEDPKLGPSYGYSSGPPDDYGYLDPKLFIGRRQAAEVCAPAEPGPTPGPEPNPGAATSDCAGGSPRMVVTHPGTEVSRRRIVAAGRVRRMRLGCRVQLSLARRSGERCAFWNAARRRMEARSCSSPLWFRATRADRVNGVTRWSRRLGGRVAPGTYELSTRLVDDCGRAYVPPGRASVTFAAR